MMLGWFKRALATNPASQFSAPKPETPFYAIGDLHGRFDLLEALLDQLDPAKPVIFVGDYVDRGENSKEVLDWLQGLTADPDIRVHCLKGNHEDMLLSFLDAPEKRGRIWLRNGGLQTLASYGVTGISEVSSEETCISAAHRLREAMGDTQINWVRNLPLYWRSGAVAVVHAGADPTKPIEDQDEQSLIWGHPGFRKTQRSDKVWVVHGHTIVDTPVAENGIISIDTGAYATGRLTAALIDDGTVKFIST